MKEITLEELLEAGCHFGHQVNRQNPRALPFIFEARNGINIINLEETQKGLMEAARFIHDQAQEGKSVVFVGTKRQAKAIVEDAIERVRKEGATGAYYVNSRWIGGTLTNFEEVSKNFKKLKNIDEILSGEEKKKYTKKERLDFQKEKDKLIQLYGGIAQLERIPDLLCIIGTHHESTAVSEAKTMGLSTVGIVDTNADPRDVEYAIPSNDDAVGAIKLITDFLADAYLEGSKKVKTEEEKKAEKEKKEKLAEKENEKKEVKKKETKSEEKPKAKTTKKEVKK